MIKPCDKTYRSNETKYPKMNHVVFVEDSLSEISCDMVCLKKPYHFKFLNAVFHKFYMVYS